MEKIQTNHPDVHIIKPKVFGDCRGWFMETWNDDAMKALGFSIAFVQDNQSYTAKKHTLRGLHFQLDPFAQCKLVRVLRGSVLDVAVDLRKGSPHYLACVAAELSESNFHMMLIPRGFAHGFLTLTDDVLFAYRADNPYHPESDRCIRFDDPAIGINWGMQNPILSQRDENAPLLSGADCNFVYSKCGEAGE